jgi:phage tail-like protein
MSPLLSLMKSAGDSAAKLAKKATPKSFKKPLAAGKQLLKSSIDVPVPAYQFSVEVDGEILAFFQSISGLSVQRKVDPQPEGGRNEYVLELPGPLSYGHVTLNMGMSFSTMFWKWMMEGQYDGKVSKKDLFLSQRAPNPLIGIPIYLEAKRWSFYQAFPVSWKLSELSVDQNTKITIETLELSFQYFELQD